MRILRNALNLILRPRLARDYFQFLWAGAAWRRNRPHLARRLGDWWTQWFQRIPLLTNFLNAADRLFLRTFPFEDGPILDVGANLGIFSLLLAKRFPKTHIHAFEPNPSTFVAMKANFVRNCCPNAHAHRLAAAAHDGEVS